jgi:AcrR family transcriptional regulator
MSKMTRKQREIQEREASILKVVRRMLLEGGYLRLSMDAVASELEYSKGTIYNHFPCKEEIIIALAIETMHVRSEMFERAALQPGRPRIRLAGIGVAAEVFVQNHPEHFRVEQLIRCASIWDKTSEKRRQAMQQSEQRCIGIVGGLIRDGIAQGDLTLPDDLAPEDLVFGLWSQTFGAYSIITTSQSLQENGVADPYRAVLQNINMTLDGYGWQPLSTDYNYFELFDSLRENLFADRTPALLQS